MKKNHISLTLFVLIAALALTYFVLNQRFHTSNDKFQLLGNVYLERVDYFSEYNLLVKENNDFTLMDGPIAKITKTKENVFYTLQEKPNALLSIDSTGKMVDSMRQMGVTNFQMETPMHWNNTLLKQSSDKTLLHIILISITVLSFAFLAHILNILKWGKR